jgi:hypothetical protein
MTGAETLLWLVVAFVEGPDCLLQGSFHWLPDGRAFVREDGCAVHSQEEGSHVVFWSESRWVAIKIPRGARSLTYRWGRAVAFVNGESVNVQHGTILNALQPRPSARDHSNTDLISKWRMHDARVTRSITHSSIL